MATATDSSGIQPVDAGAVRRPFLGPTGQTYRINGGEIQAYIYGDPIALAREVDKLDTLRVAPPTMMVEWTMPPSLIVANNLAVILLTVTRNCACVYAMP